MYVRLCNCRHKSCLPWLHVYLLVSRTVMLFMDASLLIDYVWHMYCAYRHWLINVGHMYCWLLYTYAFWYAWFIECMFHWYLTLLIEFMFDIIIVLLWPWWPLNWFVNMLWPCFISVFCHRRMTRTSFSGRGEYVVECVFICLENE